MTQMGYMSSISGPAFRVKFLSQTQGGSAPCGRAGLFPANSFGIVQSPVITGVQEISQKMEVRHFSLFLFDTYIILDIL